MTNTTLADNSATNSSYIPEPIFIVGSGRSGTTMLGEILTKANVGRSFEGHFVVKALETFGEKTLAPDELRELILLINGYESSQFFKIRLQEHDFDVHQGITARDVVTNALERVARNHPSGRWIEKTPNYIHYLPLIFKHFPNAKVIWVLRDGRDVAHSVFQKSWGANNIYYAAKAWMRANYYSDLLDSPQILTVKYEDLLSKPQDGLQRILNYLDFDAVNVEYLSNDINPQKMNRWKFTLTARQIETFEAVAYDCLQKYGYEIQNKARPVVSKPLQLGYTLHHYLKLGLHLFNENIVKVFAIKLKVKKPFDEKN